MNWKKPVFMIGAVLLCTSLLMADTPSGQTTATAQQLAPSKVTPAQLTPDMVLEEVQRVQVKKPLAVLPKAPALAANLTGATPGAAPRGATIDIVILTDNYGTETTWEVVEQGGGVIASGGPYSSNTLYEIAVEVDAASCYDFTIYDSYGDGICCSYGEGYYNVFYEGDLICTGGVFGSSETCAGIGGGCVWYDGACCVGETCVGTMIQPECDEQGGDFYEGETCPEFTCPVSSLVCPADSLFGQIPHTPDDAWSFGTSAITTSFDYLIQENFSGVDGSICDIHWWGLSLLYSGGWSACDPEGVTFNIAFYPDEGGMPGAAVCTYTDVTPTYVGTGQFYIGFEMYYYTVELLNPCCTLESGWVSIQSQMNDNDCAFLWASSSQGNGQSLQNGAAYLYDDAVCLTGEYVERWGACCDDSTGICTDDVEQQECPPPMRFTEDTLCGDLVPPCGMVTGACCYPAPEGGCDVLTQMECDAAGGDWLGAWTTCDECPPLGACCVDWICVATTFEADCEGAWFEGETCPEFECPETLADFIIQAPHEGEIQNTCGAGNDCGLGSSEDHTYEVIIPTDGIWTFSMCRYCDYDSYLYLGSTLCSSDIAMNDDYCGVVSEINSVPLLAGNYFITVAGYSSYCGSYVLDVWEEIPPTGACCVDLVCVETNTQMQCDALGGIWYAGMDCPGFECPIPGEGDFCEEPIVITAPYPVVYYGTNIGMTIDCPGLLDWNAQWYEVELPFAVNDLYWDYCPTAVDLYTVGIVWMDDYACDDYTIVTYSFTYDCPSGYTGCDLWSTGLPGPGMVLIPAYLVDAAGNGIDFEVTFNVIDAGMGACCYNEGADCEDLHEDECYAAHPDGEFYLGENCADFECPVPCTESQIDITILTDPYPYETTWEITDFYTGVVICSGGPYDLSYTTYYEQCCLGNDDCVTFTIYDSYGDGIYSPGGYTVVYNGEEVCSTMGMGWSGYSESCEMIGDACVEPTGACCVDLVCVATNEEAECDALGGRWYQNEECPDFECPDCDVDFCVTAPFTSEVLNSCGAGDDCNLRSGEEHEYGVTIPHEGLWNFNTCLLPAWDTYIFLGTDVCTQDLGYNDDSCGLQSEIIVYVGPGEYFCTVEGFSGCGDYIFDVREEIPCEVECPEGAIPEAEPCGDDTNGGCNMTDPQFEPFACMTTVCGTGWFDGGTRDTDWYVFVPTNDDTMTFAVEAEFDVLFGLIEQIVPGVPGCENTTGYLDPYQALPDCTPSSVSFGVEAGGTYYLFVAPQFTDIITCDMPNIDYVATLTGEACMCGDFDQDGDVDVDDFYFFLDAFGTCEGDEKYEEACDFDGDLCITLVDYQMWMECYREFSGKGFIAPSHRLNSRPAGQQAPMSPLTP